MLWAFVVVMAKDGHRTRSIWALAAYCHGRQDPFLALTLHRDHLFPSFPFIRYLTAGLVTVLLEAHPDTPSYAEFFQINMFSLLWLQFVFVLVVQVVAAPTPALREFYAPLDHVAALTSICTRRSQARPRYGPYSGADGQYCTVHGTA